MQTDIHAQIVSSRETDTQLLCIMRSNRAGCWTPAMVVYFLRQRLYNENRKHCAAIV